MVPLAPDSQSCAAASGYHLGPWLTRSGGHCMSPTGSAVLVRGNYLFFTVSFLSFLPKAKSFPRAHPSCCTLLPLGGSVRMPSAPEQISEDSFRGSVAGRCLVSAQGPWQARGRSTRGRGVPKAAFLEKEQQNFWPLWKIES